MKAQLSPRDLALTLAVVALWGYTFVPMRIALDEVPPFALAALRFLFAAVPLVFFVRPPATACAGTTSPPARSPRPAQLAGVALVFAGLVVNVYGPKMRAWLARAL